VKYEAQVGSEEALVNNSFSIMASSERQTRLIITDSVESLKWG